MRQYRSRAEVLKILLCLTCLFLVNLDVRAELAIQKGSAQGGAQMTPRDSLRQDPRSCKLRVTVRAEIQFLPG